MASAAKTFMVLKDQNVQLEAENASLRAALGLEKTDSPERWAAHAPQDIRDRMAASALISEKLDEPRALKRLGFVLPINKSNQLERQVWVWCEQIFGTPGVKKQLALDMADAEKNKTEIIARLVQTARHGSEGDSVRAAQQLSKMADWNAGDKAVAKAGAAKVVNLMQMLSGDDGTHRKQNEAPDPDVIVDAESFMLLEPAEEGVIVADDEPIAISR